MAECPKCHNEYSFEKDKGNKWPDRAVIVRCWNCGHTERRFNE